MYAGLMTLDADTNTFAYVIPPLWGKPEQKNTDKSLQFPLSLFSPAERETFIDSGILRANFAPDYVGSE